MPKPTREKLRAVLLHAAAKLAADRADRSELAGGDAFEVDLTIAGTINGKHAAEELAAGRLVVNHDQERKSSKACDTSHLVALLLEAIPPAKRRPLLANLPRHFEDHAGELPGVRDAKATDQASQLLAELRSVTTTTARGSIRFSPAGV